MPKIRWMTLVKVCEKVVLAHRMDSGAGHRATVSTRDVLPRTDA